MRYRPGQVVVIQEKTVPSLLVQALLPFRKHLLKFHKRKRGQIPFFFSRLLIQHHVFELKYHRKLGAVRIAVEERPLRSGAPRLTDRHQIGSLEGIAAHLPDKRMKHRPFRHNTVIRILSNQVYHIQPEAAHTAVNPPVDHIVNSFPQRRIFPVQIRLLHRKLMQVILSAFRHPFPCRAAEGRLQIIRILSLHAVTPYIKIMIGIILAFFRLQEPGMLIRTVVQNQIHDNTDPPFLRFRNQFIHILQLTENRINILIIGDIITIIIHW